MFVDSFEGSSSYCSKNCRVRRGSSAFTCMCKLGYVPSYEVRGEVQRNCKFLIRRGMASWNDPEQRAYDCSGHRTGDY